MSVEPGWEVFRTFTDLGSAEVMCMWLRREGVAAKVRARLENVLGGEYAVLVVAGRAYRARWVTNQLPPTDEELDFLATGQLPGPKEK